MQLFYLYTFVWITIVNLIGPRDSTDKVRDTLYHFSLRLKVVIAKAVKVRSFVICDHICLNKTGTWEQKFPKEATHYRNFRINEKTTVRVPMMSNKANYQAAADHELECDILQVRHSAVVNELKGGKV